MANNGSIPEAWVGETVNVKVLTAATIDPETKRGTLAVRSVNGVLKEANDKGLLILYPGQDTNQEDSDTDQQVIWGFFFPWSAVLEIAR
jgi:hypothetical protein